MTPMDRPLSASEQSVADRFRAQLLPLATAIERESTANGYACRQLLSRSDQIKAKRQRRREARLELWRQANKANPTGLGVVECWIMQWVIGQLLGWIMRHWILGGDDADQDD